MAFADGCEVLKSFLKGYKTLNTSNTIIILEALNTYKGAG